MAAPSPTNTDGLGFKYWSFDTKFDPLYPVNAQIVQVPTSWVPSGKRGFYAQIATNDATYMSRWSDKQWFETYDKANAWIQSEFKRIVLQRLYQ